MRLTPADVREAAERARLRVDAKDVARLVDEIGGVLAWADALLPPLETAANDAGAGDDGAPADTHPGAAPPLRADTPVPSPGATLLAGSAGWDGALVRVPAAR